MFRKILVANRGEIAVRVMRTCREMGIPSVAVYSEPDATALHTRYADEAFCIGPGPAPQSYLSAEKIIQVARHTGADAIHPGYGFLSEQADFAQACVDAGVVFIGPPPAAMRLLGDKVEARRIAREVGAPTVPGTPGKVSPADARALAEELGYPVLIKAAAGGGGRGIRLVEEPAALDAALRVAAGEAQSAFGDPSLYVEKYLSPVRHIEVQVLADRHGGTLHLGERECSVQRRNQKLVEESPSVAVDEDLRGRLGAAAVAIARQAGYENAGTVEFLLDTAGNFHFMEVNTRLQVEHPVTEMVTGLDLVREQIRIAAGEPLGYGQEDVRFNGWAIECRITAEDPFRAFMPNLGCIEFVSEPAGPGVRVDSCLFPGLEVPQFYDSLLAKAIAWGANRDEAVRRLQRALGEYLIMGVRTTIPFHSQLLEDPDFRAGAIHTRFLDERFAMRAPESDGNEDVALIAVALLTHERRRNGAEASSGTTAQQQNSDAWRMAGRMGAMGARGGGGPWRNTR